MDFADLPLGGVTDKIGSVVRTYEKNKTLIDSVVRFLLGLLDRRGKDEVEVERDAQHITIRPTPIPPAVVDSTKFYASLVAKCFFLEKQGRIYPREYFKDVLNPDGSNAQMVKDRMHMDITPFDKNGQEVRQHDNHPTDDDGNPALRYRWWINDEQQNDTDEDHFDLGSVLDDKGCTPTLKLNSQFGSGRHTVTFQAYIPAEFNDGNEVESEIVTWFCD